MTRYSPQNVKRMTSRARNAARKDLRFSSLSGMTSKKIISLILLLSLPAGVKGSVMSVLTAAGVYLMPIIQNVAKPLAYTGLIKTGATEAKSFLNNPNVKIYSAIVAAITVLMIFQKIYLAKTERLRIAESTRLEMAKLTHNAEQRRLNREAMNRAEQRRLEMFNKMIQGQGMVVKSAVKEALAVTQPMLLQIEQGRDPVVPVPKLSTATPASRAKQN